jgi:hypothetical protein
VLRRGERPSEAEPLYREALEINKEELGVRAAPTTRTANGLALTLSALGRQDEADAIQREYELARPSSSTVTTSTSDDQPPAKPAEPAVKSPSTTQPAVED